MKPSQIIFFEVWQIRLVQGGDACILQPDEGFRAVDDAEEAWQVFSQWVREAKQDLVMDFGDSQASMADFLAGFHDVMAAGGLVRSADASLFIFRNGKWELPKGWVEAGETEPQAAMREVREETGLDKLRIVRSLPETKHIYHLDDTGWVMKTTRWFLMSSATTGPLHPQLGEGIERAAWFREKEMHIPLANTYRSLQALLREVDTSPE